MPNLTVDSQTEPLVSNDRIFVNPSSHNLPKSILIGILIFVLLAATIYGTYWYIKNYLVVAPPQPVTTNVATEASQSNNSFSNLNNQSTSAAMTDKTVGWKTYTNNYWDVSLKYPQDKLVSCLNYTSEKEGIRLFKIGFDCPIGTDTLYKIGLVGYSLGEYKQYKQPAKTEQVMVNNKELTKITYYLDESDGPLFNSKEFTEVIINRSNGIVTLQLIGDEKTYKELFDQILSTFRFD